MAASFAFLLVLLAVSSSYASKSKVNSEQPLSFQKEYESYYPAKYFGKSYNFPVNSQNFVPSSYLNQKQVDQFRYPVQGQNVAYPRFGYEAQQGEELYNPVYQRQALENFYPRGQYQQDSFLNQNEQNQAYSSPAMNNLFRYLLVKYQGQQYPYQQNQVNQEQYYPGQNYQTSARVANKFEVNAKYPSEYNQQYVQGYYQGPYEQEYFLNQNKQNQAYSSPALNNLFRYLLVKYQGQQYPYQQNQVNQEQYYPGQNYQTAARVANKFEVNAKYPSEYNQQYVQGYFQGPYEQELLQQQNFNVNGLRYFQNYLNQDYPVYAQKYFGKYYQGQNEQNAY